MFGAFVLCSVISESGEHLPVPMLQGSWPKKDVHMHLHAPLAILRTELDRLFMPILSTVQIEQEPFLLVIA